MISLLGLCSCSNDNSSEPSISTKVAASYKAYISPQMQQTLSMLDTCTTAIPIENLIPYVSKKDTTSQESSTSITRSGGNSTIAQGFDSQTALYSYQKVTISDTQSLNFGVATGTYYATCIAITYFLSCDYSNGITKYSLNTDIIGIDPDNEIAKGFHIDTLTKNKQYIFTTYFWELRDGASSIYNPRTIPYEYSSTGNLVMIEILADWLPRLQWRYIVLS